jgi:hypothetical protein
MALHPLFAEICAAHMPAKPETYRGWTISWDYGQYWAVSPDYDASYEGEEDGWVDNGQRVSGRTIDEVYAEVDEWFAENGQFGVGA